MIHVDIENEVLEYSGSGEDLIKEISLVLCMSIEDAVKQFSEREVNRLIDLITATISGVMKEAVAEWKETEGDDEYEEERAVQEERSNEAIRTVIKQYRKGRPS